MVWAGPVKAKPSKGFSPTPPLPTALPQRFSSTVSLIARHRVMVREPLLFLATRGGGLGCIWAAALAWEGRRWILPGPAYTFLTGQAR